MNGKQEFDFESFDKSLKEATKGFAKVLAQMQRTMAAQAAMGWAYRGDLTGVRRVLKGMQPDHLAEVSAAASLLASACDEEVQRR